MMKKIILCFVLFFMLAACGEKTNFQGKYEPQETGERVITLEKINDVEYTFTVEPDHLDKVLKMGREKHIVNIKNSNQIYDLRGNYIGEFNENKEFVTKRGKVYKKVE
ncbi:hypothetical protein ACFX2V_06725 [Gilliamella apicola]|uniref:hypothetical protein n=1 Tax=Gilliamella apicola TaxID=1196095 RepID=UPI003987D22E